jgi:hypothetical protein
MNPAEAVVRPGSGYGVASGEGRVICSCHGGAAVVTGYVGREGVFVGVLVPGALDEVGLDFRGVVPFVTLGDGC